MPLTDSQCRTPNRSGRIEKRGDGGGLFLVCSPGGAKRWTLAYRFGGKQRDLAIGPYPGVTLAEARVRREEAKVQLQRGTDPAGELVAAETATLPIFRDVARRWLEVRGKAWTQGHVDRTAGRLRLNVYPFVGDKPLDQITSGDVLAAVRACETRGAIDMGRRTAQAISSVFRFAKAEGLDLENPGEGLNEAFAARRKVRHRAMIAPRDMGGFLVDLQGYEGETLTRLGIEFVIRTAVRTSELRLGTWAEVERDLWRIPPERMKMGGLEHLVPLTPQAREILKQARTFGRGSSLLFPGDLDPRKPMSQNTMIFALYRMGLRSRATVHGFRRTFSTWANEQGRWHPDAIERQLAHWPRDEVRAAYNAAEYLPQRKEMMNDWNDWLDDQKDLYTALREV